MHLPIGIAACVLALACGPAAAAPHYIATPLGALGGAYSRAHAINAHGQITGEAQLAGGTWHAFLWTDGAMRDLDTLGSAESVGRALNASGHVVGCARAGGGDFAFQHDGERMWDLRAVTGDVHLSCATGINDAGHVVGTRWSPLPAPFYAPSFLRVDGAMEDIRQAVVAVNNRDDLAGTTNRHLNPPLGWVRVAGVDLTAYPQLDWSAESHVTAINDNGRAVGMGSPSGGRGPAFIFENGVRTDLVADFLPAAINNRGEIVGTTNVGGGGLRAALYVADTVHDLNTLVVAGLDGAVLTDAVGINDAGVVVANSCSDLGPPPYPSYPLCMAYRLLPMATGEANPAPVPAHAPAALIVLAVALAASGAVSFMRRR